MTARLYCSLVAVLSCPSVCWSVTDAEGGEPAKPGVCPRNYLEVGVLGACVESCSQDSDCPNSEKCCSNGCGHQCTAPYTGKPGVCLSKNLGGEPVVCVEMCSYDSDCPNDEKCCSNGCGHQCMAPYTAPTQHLRSKLSAAAPAYDCPNDEKCCSSGCGHQCTAPYTV